MYLGFQYDGVYNMSCFLMQVHSLGPLNVIHHGASGVLQHFKVEVLAKQRPPTNYGPRFHKCTTEVLEML